MEAVHGWSGSGEADLSWVEGKGPHQLLYFQEISKIFALVTQWILVELWETYEEAAGLKDLNHNQPRVGNGNHSYYIVCLRCGGLVHWTASVCENCLANPLKERRGTLRFNWRKTFIHDDLLATVCNISGGGVQIKTKTSLSIGRVLKMAFSLEEGMIRFYGTVVYSQSLSNGNWLAGVKFDSLLERDARLLDRFLASRRGHSVDIPEVLP